MMARKFIAHPILVELAELQMARDRAERAGDIVTSIAIGCALRRVLYLRRTEQVAKRRLVRRPAATL